MIIKKEYSADMIIHLGDGAADMDEISSYLKDKPVYRMKGNCDSSAFGFPLQTTVKINDYVTICACHGHTYDVKYSMSKLFCYGVKNGYRICLFGHTHTPYFSDEENVLMMNPGAVKNGKYGVIEIKNREVIPVLKNL